MELYALFVLMATATVLSPGPGVVMTLTNALRYGFRDTFGGILGVATSLGVLLATSATAFTFIKLLGAAYLVYLGVRLWRAPPFHFAAGAAHEASFGRRFAEGLTLQFTNPKAIFFFLSVLPQFIDARQPYTVQFAVLVGTYIALVVIIHCGYALFAQRAKGWLSSERGGRLVNRVAGTTFICFGAALAVAKR